MKHWSNAAGSFIEAPEIDAFLADVFAVCEKHGMWLSHEDLHGAFEIVTESTKYWLSAASDARMD